MQILSFDSTADLSSSTLTFKFEVCNSCRLPNGANATTTTTTSNKNSMNQLKVYAEAAALEREREYSFLFAALSLLLKKLHDDIEWK